MSPRRGLISFSAYLPTLPASRPLASGWANFVSRLRRWILRSRKHFHFLRPSYCNGRVQENPLKWHGKGRILGVLRLLLSPLRNAQVPRSRSGKQVRESVLRGHKWSLFHRCFAPECCKGQYSILHPCLRRCFLEVARNTFLYALMLSAMNPLSTSLGPEQCTASKMPSTKQRAAEFFIERMRNGDKVDSYFVWAAS